MKWKRGVGYDQVEDRRGQGGGFGGSVLGGGGGGIPIPIPGGKAGGGIGGFIIAIVLFLLFSGVLGGGNGLSGLQPGGGAPNEPVGTLNPTNDTDAFVAYVVDSVQRHWAATFEASGRDYPETTLTLFDTEGLSTGCGPASPATGPFYCPADQHVYMDIGFFDELQTRFGAKGGDFAIAYVIAHEFGHHVQTVLGISESVQQQAQSDPSQANALSVKQELQADCLAGVWAHSAASDVQPGDIDEALSAAQAVGDDRIQERTQGRIDPESWTHGSAEQRVQWFTRGFQSGNVNDCDTFAS